MKPVVSRLVCKVGCLSSATWLRRPRAFLLVFNLCWKPQEHASDAREECVSHRIAALVSKSKGKKAKDRSFHLLCPFIWVASSMHYP